MRCKRLSVAIALFIVTAQCTELVGLTQAALSSQASASGPRTGKPWAPKSLDWESAENVWRSKPVDTNAQVDPTPSKTRQTRNAYWSRILAESLDMESHGIHLSTAEGAPMRLDLVPDPQATWVVAKFEGYTVLPVDPKGLVSYTEIHFRIEKVVQQPKAMALKASGKLDVDLVGGTIKTSSGELKSFDVSPRPHFVIPGNTYLLELRYFKETDSYILGRFWKVENGKLTGGYNSGSPFIGRTIDDFASQLRSVNPEQ